MQKGKERLSFAKFAFQVTEASAAAVSPLETQKREQGDLILVHLLLLTFFPFCPSSKRKDKQGDFAKSEEEDLRDGGFLSHLSKSVESWAPDKMPTEEVNKLFTSKL